MYLTQSSFLHFRPTRMITMITRSVGREGFPRDPSPWPRFPCIVPLRAKRKHGGHDPVAVGTSSIASPRGEEIKKGKL
jgi:hypothetical protein